MIGFYGVSALRQGDGMIMTFSDRSRRPLDSILIKHIFRKRF